MMTKTATCKTCQRCNGTGFVGTPVVHLGVPGLCMSCDGCGTRRWVDSDEAKTRKITELERDLADCQERGENYKLALARYEMQNRRGGAKTTALEGLAKCRQHWLRVNAELKAVHAGEVAGYWEAGR